MPDDYSNLHTQAWLRSPERAAAVRQWIGRHEASDWEDGEDFDQSVEFYNARYAYRRRVNGGANSNDH